MQSILEEMPRKFALWRRWFAKRSKSKVSISAQQSSAPRGPTRFAWLGQHIEACAELETAMLVYVNLLPENNRKKFSANAVKLTDSIKAHKMTLDLSDDARDSLGSSDFYLAFKEDAVYVAIGDGATNRLKEMLEMKPKEGPSLLVQLTPERIAPLFELFTGKELKADWSKLFPNNKKVKLLGLHLEGGPMLRVRYHADFVELLKMGLSAED